MLNKSLRGDDAWIEENGSFKADFRLFRHTRPAGVESCLANSTCSKSLTTLGQLFRQFGRAFTRSSGACALMTTIRARLVGRPFWEKISRSIKTPIVTSIPWGIHPDATMGAGGVPPVKPAGSGNTLDLSVNPPPFICLRLNASGHSLVRGLSGHCQQFCPPR
jgi:hypothetical protein